MALSKESIKESLTAKRDELATEIRSLENDLLTAKEKFLKVQGAIEILEIVASTETEPVAEAIDPDVES